ncbi:hypothetical protein [Lusitaniella coriacea]|uniref:hypothetical protein n=1 Tax=Lusitaniella coriacea TaxID=1983105 RepID=UPI003CEE5163
MKNIARTNVNFPQKLLFAPLLAFSLLFYGCGNNSEQSTINELPEATESPEESPIATEESPAAAFEGTPDIAGVIGTKEEGWMPKVLADKNLKENMTPEETGKVIPGAEEVSEFGFSEVQVEDVPEIQKYEFYFEKDEAGKPNKLKNVKLVFDPTLNGKITYEELAKILAVKYGEVSSGDIEKEIVTWVGPDFSTAQFTKGLNDFEGYSFQISVPEK